MLLLVFQAGAHRFGLDVSRIVEVIPAPLLRPVPWAPEYVAGLFDYHGAIVPVIDMSRLLAGEAARMRMSTRVVVVDYDGSNVLGLLAERATETVASREEDWRPSGVTVGEAPYLGGILKHEDGMIQRVTVEELLPDSVRETLFVRL
jgi:chemotaxis-related protein WspB